MAGFDWQFENSGTVLVDEGRLTELRTKVGAISDDLDTLAAMSPSARKDAADLRNRVLRRFRDLAET